MSPGGVLFPCLLVSRSLLLLTLHLTKQSSLAAFTDGFWWWKTTVSGCRTPAVVVPGAGQAQQGSLCVDCVSTDGRDL